jgi:hypothetical protein
MKTFVLFVLLNYILIEYTFSLKTRLGTTALLAKGDLGLGGAVGGDPFSKMSDKELEKMLKDLGMSEKEIGGIGTGILFLLLF